MTQSPEDQYLESVLMDDAEGSHCPRCGEWHAPDGMGPEIEDWCKREIG